MKREPAFGQALPDNLRGVQKIATVDPWPNVPFGPEPEPLPPLAEAVVWTGSLGAFVLLCVASLSL